MVLTCLSLSFCWFLGQKHSINLVNRTSMIRCVLEGTDLFVLEFLDDGFLLVFRRVLEDVLFERFVLFLLYLYCVMELPSN